MSDDRNFFTSDEQPAQRKQVITAVRYEGSLPPSSELEKYNVIVPGCASILIDMAVKNGEHRRFIESKQMELQEKAINADIEHNKRRDSEALRGQLFALTLGLTALVIGGVLGGYLHHFIFATIFTSIPFFSFLTAFIMGRTKDHK